VGLTSKAASGHVIELVGSINVSSPRIYIANLLDGPNTRQGIDLSERMEMNLPAVAAILCILIWIVLAFVIAIPSGWVHVPLILGVLLIVKAIVDGGRE
jgi:hypothetical protein